MRKIILSCVILLTLGVGVYGYFNWNLNPRYFVGEPLDHLNGVIVYYNGNTNNVEERNTVNGYNLGLKYQCVEFVKRYYYEYYQHKMPNSYGNAIDFFNQNLLDGSLNTERNLTQFTNPSFTKPKVGDLIVMDKTFFNSYGHVCIVSNVDTNYVEIIQQNGGTFSETKEGFKLEYKNDKWFINNGRILGWLRK